MQLLTVVFASALLYWCQVAGKHSRIARREEPVDKYALEEYDQTSRYGDYYKDNACWKDGPYNPRLPVDDQCQSAAVKLKIGYLLKKNPAVEEEIKEKSLYCGDTYFTPVGLENICPSNIAYPTSVIYRGQTCYIVKPEKQCLTYVKCASKAGCSNAETPSSTCLMSYFRSFNVWVYCEDCGFKLIELSLPQCCTCNSYQKCSG
uniref:Uncharacterized protein LOC111134271 n=1 Tax=Crassostrea virginica TaxID=6565 RepID=A0A8B8EDZ0_CRAVI|nr:uncharacterized protein LOC111134271 [Crassostrea virginica]